MKRLLLISSVLVVMMCSTINCFGFSYGGIKWSDTPDQIIEKLVNLKYLGKVNEGSKEPIYATYPDIFSSIDSASSVLKEDEFLEEMYKEGSDLIGPLGNPQYMGIMISEIYLSKSDMPIYYDTSEANIVKMFYSRETKEVFGYTLVLPSSGTEGSEKRPVLDSAKKSFGKPNKIFNEGSSSKYFEMYRWEKDGEIIYISEVPGQYSYVTMIFVNLNNLRKHIKSIKKRAKKREYININD